MFGCIGVCEEISDSDKDEKEGEALATAANDEGDSWRKTRRERLMTWDDDEKKRKANCTFWTLGKIFNF